MPTTPSSTKAKPKKSPSSKKKELSSAQKKAAPSGSPAAAAVVVNGPGELVRTSLPDGAECSLLSGGSLVEHDCSFSTDNKYLLCCSGNVVKVFSCKTGAQVRMLEGHTDQVTAVAHNPANMLQACSASLDGCIMLWDLDGALMLRCFCVGLPIAAMVIDTTMPTDAFVLTADLPPSPTTPAYARGIAVPGRAYSVKLALDKASAKQGRSRAAKVGGERQSGGSEGDEAGADANADADADAGGPMLGSLARPWPAKVKSLFKVKGAASLSVSSCGMTSPVLAVAAGTQLVAHDVLTGRTVKLSLGRELVRVALSPTELSAAAADGSGRILQVSLRSLQQSDAAMAADKGGRDGLAGGFADGRSREMHWHAQPVGAMCFSADGAYLYSAGREGVLVAWQLHSAERAFLPRLKAPILGMARSSDGSKLALLGLDNAIRLIDIAANRVLLTVQGLRRAARMAPDARLGAMVMHGGGAAGKLQWWSPLADRELLALDAAPSNLSGSLPAVFGAGRGGGPGGGRGRGRGDGRRRSYRTAASKGGSSLVHVQLACISASGRQLASLEVRSDAELQQNSCLKFWSLREGEHGDAAWRLVARVERPHASGVTGLAYHPSLCLVASTSRDCKFKLWEGRPPLPPLTHGAPPAAAVPLAPAATDGEVAEWACRSVGYYRQSAACAVAFSVDGSLMAVAYEPDAVTLWDPLTNLLLQTLCQPLPHPGDVLCFLGFPADGGALLAHSRRTILCWDVLSTTLAWSYRADEVLTAAADPHSDALLVAVALPPIAPAGEPAGTVNMAPPRYIVLEFAARAPSMRGPSTVGDADNASPVPRHVWQLARGPPRAVGFLPSGGNARGTPICLGDGEMHALLPSQAEAATNGALTNGAAAPANGALAVGAPAGPTSLRLGSGSKFEAIFGATPLVDPEAEAEEAAAAAATAAAGRADWADPAELGGFEGVAGAAVEGWEASAIDAYLKASVGEVPSHLLPPLESLAPRMMSALMRPAPHVAALGGHGEPKADVQLEAEREAHQSGREAEYKEAVAQWVPLLRSGFLGVARPGGKRRARAGEADEGADGGADEGEGPPRDTADVEAEAEAWERAVAEEAEHGPEVLLRATPPAAGTGKASRQGGLRKGFLQGGRTGSTAKSARQAERAAAPAASPRPLVLASDAGGASGAEAWPPRGWKLLDMRGVPNPGYVVRDLELPPPLWEGEGEPGKALSAEDRAFWREEAYAPAQLAELQAWMVEEGIGLHGDDAAPPGHVWAEPIEETAEQMAARCLGGGAFRGVRLTGSGEGGKDIETELLEARLALEGASIRVDPRRGCGVQVGEMPEGMQQPNAAGWQHEPTKGELKQLAKLYEQRRTAGEPAERLAVLAAALRASNCRAARRAVQEIEHSKR